MSRRPFLATTLIAALALTLAACGGAPAAQTLDDPIDILVGSVEKLTEAKSVRIDAALDGSFNVDMTGTGSATPFALDGTSASAQIDIENGNARATFTVPAFLGLSGELIQIGSTSYVKTSMTGPLYQKSESEEMPTDVASELGGLSAEDIAEFRATLAKPELSPVKGDDVQCGDKQCYTVTMEVTEAEAAALGLDDLPTDELPTDFGEGSFTVTFNVEKDTLRMAGITLAVDLGPEGALTLTLTMSGWDESVSIEAPPADQVGPGF
jgi:hypothetical protein